MKKYKKGFTLIELLVVIAIIGILSAVVLGSLNSAREKGKNAAAKSELSSVRAQASIYFDDTVNNQSFGEADTSCSSSSLNIFNPSEPNNVTNLITSAESRVSPNTAVCANSTDAYVIALPLLNGDNWCVDSTGYSGTTTLALGDPGVQGNIACQ